MKYSYLLINLSTIFFPLVLSFDKRVHFAKSWKYLWPGVALTGLIFLFWDVLFTINHVWSFNNKYITGITLFHLPLEEILFFLTVPFACIFIYACLNHYFKRTIPQSVTLWISIIILALSVILLTLFYRHLYSAVTFSLVAVLLILLQFIFKVKWLPNFYRAYLVTLIPFYIINGILTSVPVVMYNNAQNMSFKVGTIPFEDHFYLMALLLMNIGFFEYFRNRAKLA